MPPSPNHHNFVFNDQFNSQYINELYDGDTVMIEETFADVLNEYDSFLLQVKTSHQAQDLGALKSAIHKIKPLCGYVGLTGLQSRCQHFENACQEGEVSCLEKDGTDLIRILGEAKAVIQAEKARLAKFNDGPPHP
ncbi:MAG TPA: Hpt domain-containing protein [Puia sp.]|nr:Hpt domain-containing protein [Puia sp.]